MQISILGQAFPLLREKARFDTSTRVTCSLLDASSDSSSYTSARSASRRTRLHDPRTPATTSRTPAQTCNGLSTSAPHARSTNPQTVFAFTSTPANLCEFRSLPDLVHHSLSHYSLILFAWFPTSHDKSTSNARIDMTLPVSVSIQLDVSLSSPSRCCLHLKSGLYIADLDRTANRSSTRVPSALIRHGLVVRLVLQSLMCSFTESASTT